MTLTIDRRTMILSTLAMPFSGQAAFAQTPDIMSADQAHAALVAGEIHMIDVRTRDEWNDTGIAQNAWPISMHEARFQDRLLAAHDLAKDTPIALICAVGGRSGWLFKGLKANRFSGFIDVSEGMMGSSRGPGWIARGLPVVDLPTALAGLPEALV